MIHENDSISAVDKKHPAYGGGAYWQALKSVS